MAHVIVLGATGRVGAATVDLALADGFTVTAVARTPARVTRRHPRLTVVPGDTSDVVGLGQALRQARESVGRLDGREVVGPRASETEVGDACVVMAVGADPLTRSTLVGDTVANLIDVMPGVGLHRYLGVSGVAQMPATALGRATQAAIRRGVKAALDHQRAYDLLVESDLDWLVAGCPYIKDGHPPGRALEHRRPFPGGYHVVSPRDVATFLVRHLNDRYRREIIGLW